MPNSKGFSQPSDNNAAIFQTSKAAFFHVFSLRSPPGPGDDIQLASALGPPEQPRAVSTAYGNVEPADAAELTSARYCESIMVGCRERWGGSQSSAIAEKLPSLLLDGYMFAMATCWGVCWICSWWSVVWSLLRFNFFCSNKTFKRRCCLPFSKSESLWSRGLGYVKVQYRPLLFLDACTVFFFLVCFFGED